MPARRPWRKRGASRAFLVVIRRASWRRARWRPCVRHTHWRRPSAGRVVLLKERRERCAVARRIICYVMLCYVGMSASYLHDDSSPAAPWVLVPILEELMLTPHATSRVVASLQLDCCTQASHRRRLVGSIARAFDAKLVSGDQELLSGATLPRRAH